MPPTRGGPLINYRYRASTVAVFMMAIVLALGFAVGPAAGAEPQRLQALEARAAELADQHNEAAERLQAINEEAAEQNARLEELVARQYALQEQLNARALGMYRGHRLEFIDVLTNSASFSDFASRLELLTRMNVQDARDLVELRATKLRVEKTGANLLERQRRASAELRKLAAAERAAKAELSANQAAYDAYRARLRAAAASRAASSATLAARPAPDAAPKTRPAAPAPSTSGGGWQTAVASHYGKGSWGRRTADGTRVGPDSMIVAHKTLPFGTLVQFEFRGRTCVARVADRGPYTAGRTWDLGPGVIRVLDFNGVHKVRYRILSR